MEQNKKAAEAINATVSLLTVRPHGDGATYEVPALVLAGELFAVHPSLNYQGSFTLWTLTHVPTGMAVWRDFTSAKNAANFAQGLTHPIWKGEDSAAIVAAIGTDMKAMMLELERHGQAQLSVQW